MPKTVAAKQSNEEFRIVGAGEEIRCIGHKGNLALGEGYRQASIDEVTTALFLKTPPRDTGTFFLCASCASASWDSNPEKEAATIAEKFIASAGENLIKLRADAELLPLLFYAPDMPPHISLDALDYIRTLKGDIAAVERGYGEASSIYITANMFSEAASCLEQGANELLNAVPKMGNKHVTPPLFIQMFGSHIYKSVEPAAFRLFGNAAINYAAAGQAHLSSANEMRKRSFEHFMKIPLDFLIPGEATAENNKIRLLIRIGTVFRNLPHHRESKKSKAAFEQAIEHVRTVVEKYAELAPDLRKALGDLYELHGDITASKIQYEKAARDYAKTGIDLIEKYTGQGNSYMDNERQPDSMLLFNAKDAFIESTKLWKTKLYLGSFDTEVLENKKWRNWCDIRLEKSTKLRVDPD